MTVDLEASSDSRVATAKRSRFSKPFSNPGLVLGLLFFGLSLLPSLLPRAPYVQGVVSGITVMVGYGIGAGGEWLWRYLEIPPLRGRARTVVLALIFALVGWIALHGIWRQVGWQNDIRELFGMPAVSPLGWPIIIAGTFITALIILAVARGIGRLFRALGDWLNRRLPRRVSSLLGGLTIALLIWLLFTDVLVRGFFAGANAMFASRDGGTPTSVSQPIEPERTGNPQSLVPWDTLGRQGRIFAGWGPRAADINEFSGGGAVEPVRAYVGLRSAETLQERADLLRDELIRAGAFERKALVVATTTGTGFVDQRGIEPIEHAYNGDIAIAGVQYSYLPSWISLLADQQAVKETSVVVFDTIHKHWLTLPADERPEIYLYGLSLGSFGVESILNSVNIINEPIDGALMVGPPFVNQLHGSLLANREEGTPPWQPVYRQGTTVRFTAEQGGLENTQGPWGPTRLVYLQHNSDPVVFFAPKLAYQPPDWLFPGQRGPDISQEMGWFPLVTMWQVGLDLPGAGNVPFGYGHMYSYRANTESWAEVMQFEEWSPEKTERLTELLLSRPSWQEAAAEIEESS